MKHHCLLPLQRIAIIAVLVLSALSAAGQDVMHLRLKSGAVVDYRLDDVEEVVIEAPDHAMPADVVDNVGGTVAEPVDLGLSVKWASHNLGASMPQQAGAYTSEKRLSEVAAGDDIATKLWGSDWRTPTAEEWQELYDKCTWEWQLNSGILGRLVTGPSGNSIFLPAAGVEMEQMALLKQRCGLYWTAELGQNTASEAQGLYFDSANIYQMSFPRSDAMSIRPVADNAENTAKSSTWVVVELLDGQRQSFVVTGTLDIQHAADSLLLRSPLVEVSYYRGDVKGYSFQHDNSINAIQQPLANNEVRIIRQDRDHVVITGLKNDAKIALFATDGKALPIDAQQIADGCIRLTLSHLSMSVVLINIPGVKTFKLTR